ncbi:MAG TPA: SGNH/GDSL hydrolase family protein [Granulicella sp.]|jgi:lysophospholipase L1-like esterase|nr:SGNH/GDSL hydrolase family protein [Granulicella sp.]
MKTPPAHSPAAPMNEPSLIRALPLLLLLALTSCAGGNSSSTPIQNPAAEIANAGNFSTTVFLGDSLTAGYQSGSLLDIAEIHGWAPVLASQAKFPIVQALVAYPGAPGTLLLKSPGPPPVIVTAPGITTGRDNFATQVTDLAVPGAMLNDIANTVPAVVPTTPEQIITQLVLGFPGLGYGQDWSQATFAVHANPTTIFLWAGNNDALVADLTGSPASMTSTADFTTQYTALIQLLTTRTNAHLVIANIPDVTLVPYLTPAALVLAEYSAATHLPTATLSALFGIVPGDLVTPEGLIEINAILAGTQKTPLSDAGVLTAAEAVAVRAQVTAYNQVIAAQTTAANGTLVDINALFTQVATTGLTINGYTGTNAFLGGFFSLDGIHPTNTGYAVVANTFIDTMNASFKTTIPDIALGPVVAADPLWPPNIVPNAAPGLRPAAHIALSAEAARNLNQTLLPDRLQHP